MTERTSIIAETREAGVMRGGRSLLDKVSCEVRRGALTVLLGPNGAGKTTLFRLLCGEWAPDTGEVFFDGRALPEWDRRALARRRAVVPQHSSLNFPFRVHEVVNLGTLPHARGGRIRNAEPRLEAILRETEVDTMADRLYPTLSGGEKQRVHYARALAQLNGAPEEECALFLDEPTSSLDWPHQQALLESLRQRARQGLAVLAILHDLNLAMAYADEVWLMRDGVLRASGPPQSVLTEDFVADVFNVQLHRWEEAGFERPLLAMAPRQGKAVS